MRHLFGTPAARTTARTLWHALVALVVATAGLAVLAAPAQAADRDCGDFDTQAQAQRFFVDQGGPRSDPHRLDADDDGKACDSLPCPCSSRTGGGGGGTSTGGSGGSGGSGGGATLRQSARVVKVVDGDTVRVRLGSGARRDVRMIGIDTPEVYGGAECGGSAASANLRRMLPVGARVTLVSDASQARVDRYGRLLRYVVFRDRDLNRAQVWTGHSKVYVYGGDPFRRVSSYRTAQSDARAARRGLWRTCW